MLSADIANEKDFIRADIVNIFVGECNDALQITLYEFIPNFSVHSKKPMAIVLPIPREGAKIIDPIGLRADNFFLSVTDLMESGIRHTSFVNQDFDNTKKYTNKIATSKSFYYLESKLYDNIELLQNYVKENDANYINKKVLAGLESYRHRDFAFLVAKIEPHHKNKRCILAYTHDIRHKGFFFIPAKINNSQIAKESEMYNLILFIHGGLPNKYYQNEISSSEILILPNFTPTIANNIVCNSKYISMMCYDKTKEHKNEDLLGAFGP